MNLCQFKNGSIVEDVYTSNHYRIIENDKHGMSVVENLSNGKKETWNACNNNRFIELRGQLELKFE